MDTTTTTTQAAGATQSAAPATPATQDATATTPPVANPTPNNPTKATLAEAFKRVTGGESPEAIQADIGKQREPAKAPTSEAGKKKAPEPSATAKPTDTPPKVEPEKLEKARNALKRWHYPDDVLKGMSPEKLIELGDHAAKAQADQDRMGNELASLKKSTEKPTEGKAPPVKPDAAPANGEGGGEADPFADLEADEFIGEYVPQMRAAVEARTQKAVAELTQAHQQAMAAMTQQMEAMQFQFAAASLAREIPDLADPAKLGKVQTRARQLANLPQYRNEGALDAAKAIRDAFQLEFGQETQQRHQQQLRQRYAQQSAGQVAMDREPGQAPAAALTHRDLLKRAAQGITQGRSRDEVSREINSMAVGR